MGKSDNINGWLLITNIGSELYFIHRDRPLFVPRNIPAAKYAD